ncbi:MAG: trypsin-like peptidase domain-containing protein [Hyphomonadaceae bacterium]
MALLAAGAPAAPAQDADPAVEAAENGAVRVAVIIDSWQGRFLHSTGSGFVVAPNLVATNAHVVAPARDYSGITIAIIPPNGRGLAEAQVVAVSASADLALLRFSGPSPEPLTISTVEPRAGDPVVALGYPDVDDLQRPAMELVRPTPPSRSSGDIASLRDRAPTGDLIPTINHEAAISSGSSGGPLLDSCGRVIGVNTWHARGAQTYQGRGVATRTAQLISFLRQAGVTPQTSGERCLSFAERAIAERDQAVEAMAQQNADITARLEEAERLTRTTLIAAIAGGVLFLLALGTLVVTLFIRRQSAAPHLAADGPWPEAQPPAPPAPAPTAHAASPVAPPAASETPYVEPFPDRARIRGGFVARNWPILLVIGSAVFAAAMVMPLALQIMSNREGMRHASFGARFAGVQECALAEQSQGGTRNDMSFTIDANACVNDRTMYAPAGQSLRYVSLSDRGNTLAVLTLNPGNGQLRREIYRLSPTQMSAAQEATRELPPPNRCVFGEAAREQVARRYAALMRFADGEPTERTVWRCQRRGS